MRMYKIQVVLFVLISVLATSAQDYGGLKLIVRSQEVIDPPTSDMPTDLRVNLQLRNDSQKDVYIFGSNDGGGFEPLFHLLAYDDKRNEWLLPRFKWDQASDDERQTYRLRRGRHFDFYTTLARRATKRTYKAAIHYANSRNEKPFLFTSGEFSVDKAP